MRIIQIKGLRCTGKTTALKKLAGNNRIMVGHTFLAKHPSYFDDWDDVYIDEVCAEMLATILETQHLYQKQLTLYLVTEGN